MPRLLRRPVCSKITGMHTYSLLVTDIDGTLLDGNGRLPPENVRALQQWVDGGRFLALATGRNITLTRAIAQAINRPMHLVLQDGGLVAQHPSMRVLAHHNLAVDAARAAHTIFQQEFLSVMAFDPLPDGQHFTVCQNGPLSAGFEAYLGPKSKQIRCGNGQDSISEAPSKIISIDGHHKSETVYHRLKTEVPQARVMKTEAVRLDSWFVEVGSPFASKAQGLHTLLRHLNLTLTDVIAVGDAENDVEMLRIAGLGVAMGNASDRVKDAADQVIQSNIGAGLAQFLNSALF